MRVPSSPTKADMDEILPGLWLGSLASALDTETLKAHNIRSVLSAMRGRITVKETFIRHQISLDDIEDADILMHFLPAIQFIKAELAKGRGVLVHCHAGVSRSASIVTAFLMYTQDLTPQEALKLVRKARPMVEPNAGFLQQLVLFHKVRFDVSNQNPDVRRFYMTRTTNPITSGSDDGVGRAALAQSTMSAELGPSHTRSTTMNPSKAVTPQSSAPKSAAKSRRIRCKMCRHELAAREHMLDHGQIGPPTPKVIPVVLSDEVESIASATLPSAPETLVTEEKIESTSSTEKLGQILSDSIGLTSGHPKAADGLALTPSDLPISVAPDGSRYVDLSALSSQPSSTPVAAPPAPVPPPILVNATCSGYFVEPMKWMDSFLDSGETAGKIVCPNKRCGAKLGNYDWAGQCCGCKQWVTPGFCINRSKVDEVVV
ncbi:protein-tyrosine phosphatase-like protein [Coprinopsis sp. MPI-PUGE-AT-0042]|nr:protein-tyrosine phosphatase-like protein [Coprinopsis sp. MPI-PUGE-AT-0042]